MPKKTCNKFISEICKLPSQNINQWRMQKKAYYQHGSADATDDNIKYPMYWSSCLKYNTWLDAYPEKLNGPLCDDIIEILANDSVQAFQSKIIEAAEKFETNIVDKFKMIVGCIKGMRVLDQEQQLGFWNMLKEKHSY